MSSLGVTALRSSARKSTTQRLAGDFGLRDRSRPSARLRMRANARDEVSSLAEGGFRHAWPGWHTLRVVRRRGTLRRFVFSGDEVGVLSRPLGRAEDLYSGLQ